MKRATVLMALAVVCAADLFARTAEEIIADAGLPGGLVVVLGCGDPELLMDLSPNDRYIVQGLDTDMAKVEAARKAIRAKGAYGRVSVAPLLENTLPYVDNLVNLIVIRDARCGMRDEELERVLCPNGVLIRAGQSTKLATAFVKPRPSGLDEWPQYFHGPDNNPVSRDAVIRPPIRQLQWTGGPDYSRLHENASSVQAMVSSGGRVFTIIDEGCTFSKVWPSHWRLVARDAFNGIVLWKKPIEDWVEGFGLKSGPATVPRRLIADGDDVYVTLGLSAPVTRLDARTGEARVTFEGTEKAEEMVLDGETLYVLQTTDVPLAQAARRIWKRSPRNLLAVDTRTASIKWQTRFAWVVPLSLTVGEQTLYICDGDKVIAIDKMNGSETWSSETLPRRPFMPTYFGIRMIAVPGGVLYVGGENWIEHVGSKGRMLFLNESDGSIRWQADHMPSGYQSPEDLFVIGDTVWNDFLNMMNTGTLKGRAGNLELQATGEFFANNLSDGKPGRVIPGDPIIKEWYHHHRCHPARATVNYFITSRTGIEVLDIKTGQWHLNHWVRGACLYGLMPANGLIYAPQHPCACYAEAKLTGVNALAPPRGALQPVSDDQRLTKGPAFMKAAEGKAAPGRRSQYSASSIQSGNPQLNTEHSTLNTRSDWPTYRGGMDRYGYNPASLDKNLAPVWTAEIGGRLSPPVVADGNVFVAAIDAHAIHAIDAKTGEPAWTFTAGGRVDSPPTIRSGRVYFGCADGNLYCLDADDGALAWSFLAAPARRNLMDKGQLESVWPVHGSVLVRDDVVYALAGRSMFLDGGLTLYRLNAATGEILSKNVMDHRDPLTGKDAHHIITTTDMATASPDILSCDGKNIYMRSQAFDLDGKRKFFKVTDPGKTKHDPAHTHLFCNNGFIGDPWFHRNAWIYGSGMKSASSCFTWPYAPSGKIMAVGPKRVYAYFRRPERWSGGAPVYDLLYAVDKSIPKPGKSGDGFPRPKRGKNNTNFAAAWTVTPDIIIKAMAVVGDTLCVAGPLDIVDEGDFKTRQDLALYRRQEALWNGAEGSRLVLYNAADGAAFRELALSSVPVFDGLAAAAGCLLISLTDGQLTCLSSLSTSNRRPSQ